MYNIKIIESTVSNNKKKEKYTLINCCVYTFIQKINKKMDRTKPVYSQNNKETVYDKKYIFRYNVLSA